MSYLKYDGSLAVDTPAPAANQFGSSAGYETLTGTSGADGLAAAGPNDLLVGNGGGDTFYIQASGTRIQESAGGPANEIVAWQNINLANYSNIQNLSIGGSNTYAAGNSQDNEIIATGSHQQLYGGLGQDVLVGDGQSDTFIIVKGQGADAIYGFNAASDVVRLSAGYTSFAQLQQHMTQVGSDVNIDLGGGSATVIRGVTTGQLSAANFQLQLDTTQLGKLTFGDEFNGLNLWNGSTGTWATTFWYQDAAGNGGTIASNGEQEWYINANYAGTSAVKPWVASNGVLTITAAPASSSISPLINGYQYTSGEINTFHSFAQTYGYFEMRAELPHVAGGWPAFWLVPEDGSWPPELDVMETLTKDPNADYTTEHSAATGTHTMNQGVAFVPDTADGYHTYGVLWTKTDLTWYVDGVAVYHTATPADMNKPMYMIANLAVGGWGGAVDDSGLPAQMKIDYIRAYGLADGSSSVSLNSAPADTTAGAIGQVSPVTAAASTTTTTTTTTTTPTTPTPTTSTGTTAGAGQVFTSPTAGSVETGGAGNDTFNASQGSDTLTGGGGANLFVFKNEPWAPDHITDFKVGTDKLDLTALFKTAGYSGSDPVADHYIYLAGDGNGGTIVRFDHDGTGSNPVWPNTIIDLDHVSPTGLTWSQLSVSAPATGATSTSGAASPTTTSTTTTTPTAPLAIGQVFTSPAPGSVEVGTAGPDTFYASVASDTLTGGAGADVFVFSKEPWAPIHITDFQVGSDRLDLTALFKTAGYSGSDPVADHYIYLASDGNGGTIVRFDHDGTGPSPQWPNTIIDLEHVSPTGLTWAQLSVTSATPGGGGTTGGGGTSGGGTGGTGGTAGQVLTSPGPGSVETGGSGPDTFYASQGGDTLTGGGGADVFVFKAEPWAPDHITDFVVGTDKLDLTALFQTAGYTGSDPVADHYIYLASDGNGGTIVRFDHDGTGPSPQWPNTIIDLDHVSPTGLTWSQLTVSAPTSGGGGTTGGGGTIGGGGTSGQVFTSPGPGSVEVGTAGPDTFNASQGSDTLTGGAGADLFNFPKEPWAPIHITDFTPGTDKLDLRALFQAAGYTGTNPIADHYMYVESDGSGGSVLRFDRDGAGPSPQWPNTIIDLEHVLPGQVSMSDWIIH